ncbi:MAG TPA: cation diffusion facilitator family transporter [Anaerolineae bacterium]|nr:cation diffusion facilitator family transporter [Anaerolineae bacterium]
MSQSHFDNDADHDHTHEHDHKHTRGLQGWLLELFSPHEHGHYATALDPAMANARGIWAVKVSLIALLVTAVFQLFIVAISGSVALLADTIHNFSDALTAIPLWIAFTLARRPRNDRYTYGYGRAEDLAGVLIVVMIFLSAIEVFQQSIDKIVHPQPVTNLSWVATAAIIGFIGNEAVAIFRTRIGREIGSAALIADGLHARTDGFTSPGVLVGVIGVALGLPLADPLIGIVIGVAILIVVWNTAQDMWYRLMDAVDPVVSRSIVETPLRIPGVLAVRNATVCWLGHRQRAELSINVADDLSVVQSHQIAEVVRHDLFHALPALSAVIVHVDPEGHEFHSLTAHHQAGAPPS